jgi:NADH dehydrogenase [ubiquinone] 1 alpha subcomplex assembly factor 1
MTYYIHVFFILFQIIIMQKNEINIPNSFDKWSIVNDNVMGGLSESNISISENETLIFKGRVSLDNNGGFASVRYNAEGLKVGKDQKLKITLIGDSKEYQIRIKPNRYLNYNYSKSFKTTNSKQTIVIPLNELVAQFRGRKLNKGNFNYDQIGELGILIGNKRNEEFKLEIINIELIN